MDAISIALALLDLDKGKRDAIITQSVKEYLHLLYAIVSDIYDSCIEDYYAKRIPDVYDRHGNLEGFNLYRANEIEYENLYLDISIISEQLLPYGKEDSEDVRDYVLSGVMKGLRGVGSSKLSGWPKRWSTSYPNKFSKMGGIWSSKKRTLNGILDDFVATAFDNTEGAFWDIVASKL